MNLAALEAQHAAERRAVVAIEHLAHITLVARLVALTQRSTICSKNAAVLQRRRLPPLLALSLCRGRFEGLPFAFQRGKPLAISAVLFAALLSLLSQPRGMGLLRDQAANATLATLTLQGPAAWRR